MVASGAVLEASPVQSDYLKGGGDWLKVRSSGAFASFISGNNLTDIVLEGPGTIDGNVVNLHDVRNFEWRSETDYTVRWETRSYDLDRLESVDMIMSYWSGPSIAHMLMSFGFGGGDHVVFSVEIRPEKGESFSEIGGFFDEFELSIVAADERDVIRVRTNVRGEDDYLYRINMPKSAMSSPPKR